MQLSKTGLSQFHLQVGNRVEGGGAVCEKAQKFFVDLVHNTLNLPAVGAVGIL
jgi:hypothetical protein